ncbi:hypothetical protein ABEG17_02450 [Pedococcus sp. KACC 23699]|uniref:Apea-like HEPN domain-containing protein n=1 Tax=Pedococcus sp. KACC 23699 TaxID=3149228 RepID=A0AAU7JV57_9MICO
MAGGTYEPEIWIGDDEPIATFFLRLPETVGWPQGVPVRDLVKMGPELHRLLDTPSSGDALESGDAPGGKFENLTRAHVLASSILFHQVEIDLVAALGMDATMAAVEAGLPKSQESPSDVRGEEFAAVHPAGYSTVAEVAIPLQTLAAIRAADRLDDKFVMPDPEAAKELMEPAFDAAVRAVGSFQAAYHAATRRPLTLLTGALLPPLVPYVLRTHLQIAAKEPAEVCLFHANSNFVHASEAPTLEPEQVDAVFEAGRRDPALRMYLDLHQQGSAALFSRGNTREAIVMMAAASEALLNITLCHMRWEDGLTPEQSAGLWRQGLATRVKTQYANLLGGDWKTDGNGAVGRWADDVAAVRHRVVHGGYLPSVAEAEQSIESLERLLTFIGDRLVYGSNLRRYPRTASELLNESGLRRRGRYPKWLQELQVDPAEPLWHQSFSAWYAAHSRLLGDEARPRIPEELRSQLLCVHRSREDYIWVLRDPLTHQAAEAEVVTPPPNDDPVANFQRIQEAAEGGSDPRFPISVAYARSEEVVVTRLGPWVEEYHLCPLAGVMLDGSDVEAPWPIPPASRYR